MPSSKKSVSGLMSSHKGLIGLQNRFLQTAFQSYKTYINRSKPGNRPRFFKSTVLEQGLKILVDLTDMGF